MKVDDFYLHRIDMIDRALPAISKLYYQELLKTISRDITLKYEEKQYIRDMAGLAVQASELRHTPLSQRPKAGLWQRFKAWARLP